MILLSASYIVSGNSIKWSMIKGQLFKSCMKFQYIELQRKKKFYWKEPEYLQIGLGESLLANEENISKEEEKKYD